MKIRYPRTELREILFRGKRKSPDGEVGEWRYGSLYKPLLSDDRAFIHVKDCIIEIEPSTIGQFTGKYDARKTNIFEGDILYSSRIDEYFVVVWDKSSVRFILSNESATADWLSHDEYEIEYKVVGTIYDNPELVRGD